MMSSPRAYNLPSTYREKSSWTPKHHQPSNEKIFVERMALIKKWYHSWSEQQRWVLVEHILRHLSDAQLTTVHDLLHPVMPPPNHDFTRVLPRHLCLRILSYLDPQSLCRAAQVCWYWKYLAECHALWQPKCLTLGWFLPTPPSQFDITAWKRHYVACVCQLHWNPPIKKPDSLNGEGTLTDDQLQPPQQVSPTVHKRRKPAVITRHSMHQDRRPWRDPDLHPNDIHFKHDVATGLESSGNRFPHCRSDCQGESHDQINYQPMLSGMTTTTALPHPHPHTTTLPHPHPHTTTLPHPHPHTTSPPSALMHPTLLEKMRLGTPTSGHIHLSTMNRTQSQHAVMDEFYRLQDASPFPRLPPYYVHGSTVTVERTNERDKVQRSPLHLNGKIPRSRSEWANKHRSANGEVSTNEGQQTQLLLHPWIIPDSDTPDSDD